MDTKAAAERHRLRVARLLDVREQSKHIAKKFREDVKAEREKQIDLFKKRKQKEYNFLKSQSIGRLQREQISSLHLMGEAHSNAQLDGDLEREWKSRREINALNAQLRENQARLHRKKSSDTDSRLNEVKQRVSSRSISKKVSDKDNVIVSGMPKSPARSSNKKISSDIPHNVKKTTLKDIQQELCDCKPHSNDRINNNSTKTDTDVVLNKHITESGTEPSLHNDKKIQDRLSDMNNEVDHDDEQNLYINTASEFIKNRNLNQRSDSDRPEGLANQSADPDIGSLRDVIQQSRNFNYNLPQHPPIPDLPKSLFNKNFPDTKCDSWTISHEVFKNQPDKPIISKPQNTFRNKTKSKLPPKNIRPVEFYDHPNRFRKTVTINNDDVVERLSKGNSDAFQNALHEIEENRAFENFIKKRTKEHRKHICERGGVAIEKIKFEKEYKKLLEKLDHLQAAERQNARNMNINESADDFNLRSKNDNLKDVHKMDSLTATQKIKAWKVNKSSLNMATEGNFSDNHSDSSHSIILKKMDISRNVSSSSKSSYSFKDFQIIIHVQKNQKISAQVIKSDNKVKEINPTEISSNEASVKTPEYKEASVHDYDNSESTVYKSPPDKITTHFEKYCSAKKDFEIEMDKRESVMIEKCVGTSMESEMLVNKSVQVNYENSSQNSKKPKASQRKSLNETSEEKLKEYVIKLLNMKKSDVEKLNVDVSNISTPSSSVINISTNVGNEKDQSLENKMEKFNEFLQHNYRLLENIDKKLTAKNSSGRPDEANSLPINEDSESDIPLNKSDKNVIPIQSKNTKNVSPVPDFTEPLSQFRLAIPETSLFRPIPNPNDLRLTGKKTPSISSSETSNESFIINSDHYTASSESTSGKALEFIPMLSNIPKPEAVQTFLIPETPKTKYPAHHELSTILEVDTPVTLRNTTKNSEMSPIKLKLPVLEDSVGLPENPTPFASLHEDKDLNNLSNVSLTLESLNFSNTLDPSTRNLMADFHEWLKDNKISWGPNTLKKIQESSSSFSISDSKIRSPRKGKSTRLDFLSDASSSSSLSSDDLISKSLKGDELLKQLRSFSNKFEEMKNVQLSKRSEKKSTESSMKSSEVPIVTEGDVTDKTQHRTSTPVFVVKSSFSLSSTNSNSQSNSNGLFNIESDISSVKNLSNSDKNVSDDATALSVPNVSLKFRKLFD